MHLDGSAHWADYARWAVSASSLIWGLTLQIVCRPQMMNIMRILASWWYRPLGWLCPAGSLGLISYMRAYAADCLQTSNDEHHEDFSILMVSPIGLIMPGGQSRPHLLYEGLRCRLSADLKWWTSWGFLHLAGNAHSVDYAPRAVSASSLIWGLTLQFSLQTFYCRYHEDYDLGGPLLKNGVRTL